MQDKLTVVATRDGGPGEPAALGDDRDGFSWSGNDAVLGMQAGRQLEALSMVGAQAVRFTSSTAS